MNYKELRKCSVCGQDGVLGVATTEEDDPVRGADGELHVTRHVRHTYWLCDDHRPKELPDDLPGFAWDDRIKMHLASIGLEW